MYLPVVSLKVTFRVVFEATSRFGALAPVAVEGERVAGGREADEDQVLALRRVALGRVQTAEDVLQMLSESIVGAVETLVELTSPPRPQPFGLPPRKRFSISTHAMRIRRYRTALRALEAALPASEVPGRPSDTDDLRDVLAE